eukprot:COSAG02_NODE_146_length_33985_cov_263.461695_28_plen_166_part_00
MLVLRTHPCFFCVYVFLSRALTLQISHTYGITTTQAAPIFFLVDAAGRCIVQISEDGSTVTLGFALRKSSHGPVGGSAMVCGGSGVGQHARIVATSQRASDNATVVTLFPPLDAHVVAGKSTLCLTATVGSKIVSGNSFNNGMVVQWFGTTSRGVIADNNFTGTS